MALLLLELPQLAGLRTLTAACGPNAPNSSWPSTPGAAELRALLSAMPLLRLRLQVASTPSQWAHEHCGFDGRIPRWCQAQLDELRQLAAEQPRVALFDDDEDDEW
jgi:hypothetical protein